MISPNRRERRDKRVTFEVVVMLSGQTGEYVPEWASTENISARGARILTTHRWRPNDGLLIRCVDATLQARGRVVYRQSLSDNLSAIGVKLLAPKGSWRESSEVQPDNGLAVAG
jgi:hypothetical protein